MKILLVTLLLSSMAFAMIDKSTGDWGSGGGNAIVCFNSATIAQGEDEINILETIKENKNIIPDEFLFHIKSIEMYDLYEAKKRRGLSSEASEIIEIKEDEKIYDYIDRVGNRFSATNYSVQGFIFKGKELLPDSRLIFEDTAVPYQNDLGTVALPGANCVISTMAAQVNNHNLYNAYIDRRLFEHAKHSKQSQATLILHELIYANFRRYYNHKDSGATRNIVRLIISYHESITEKLVADTLYDLGVYRGESDSLINKFELSNIMYFVSVMTDIFIEDTKKNAITEIDKEKLNTIFNDTTHLAEDDGLFIGDYTKLNYGSIFDLITRGLAKGSNKAKWAKIEAKFLTIYEKINIKMNNIVTEYFFNLDIELSNTHITSDDRDNLHKHIEVFLRYDNLYSLDKGVNAKMIDSILTLEKKNFKNPLFTQFFYVLACEEEICFKNILLNNIIPRDF